MQRQEVSLLTEELKRTKKIIEAQQDLAKEQSENLKVQLFEGSFFNFFGVFTKLVEDLDLRGHKNDGSGVISSGKDVLGSKLKLVSGFLTGRPDTPSTQARNKQYSEEAYQLMYEENKSDLGHYFRTLYNLVKFVDQSDVANERLYTNLIRAQLSDDEAMLLFLNGLTERGEKFKPLIEKYAMLKNVDQSHKLFERANGRYKDSAFD